MCHWSYYSCCLNDDRKVPIVPSLILDLTGYDRYGLHIQKLYFNHIIWYFMTFFLYHYLMAFKLTSQESPVYWEGQEHFSTKLLGPPVPEVVAPSRPTSPKLSLWLWVKYKARILRPTRPAKTIISSSLETGLLLIACRQFPCKQHKVYRFILRNQYGEKEKIKWL